MHMLVCAHASSTAVLLTVLHSCLFVQEVAHGATAGPVEATHDPFWL